MRSTSLSAKRLAAKSLSGGLLAAALLLGGTAAQAQEVTLRLHQFLPPQATIPSQAIAPWIEKVESESDGRIEIQHYPAMQLGGAPPSLFDQARDGVVDIIWTVLGYTPGRFPKTEAFELPFMVTTGEATSKAFHEYVTANALDEFADVRPLVFHTHGAGLLHVKGEGVRAMEGHGGPEAARSDAGDHQDAGAPGRHRHRHAGAGGAGIPLQGRDRRRGDPLGGHRPPEGRRAGRQPHRLRGRARALHRHLRPGDEHPELRGAARRPEGR